VLVRSLFGLWHIAKRQVSRRNELQKSFAKWRNLPHRSPLCGRNGNLTKFVWAITAHGQRVYFYGAGRMKKCRKIETALSNTTISGYDDVAVSWNSGIGGNTFETRNRFFDYQRNGNTSLRQFRHFLHVHTKFFNGTESKWRRWIGFSNSPSAADSFDWDGRCHSDGK